MQCSKCKEFKLSFEMSLDRSRKGGISSWCKLCRSANARVWFSKNTGRLRKSREITPRQSRDYILKHRYGLNSQKYDDLLVSQNHLCAICGRDSRDMTYYLHVDHDHTTNRVRGLLCAPCNVYLGYIKDDVTKLNKAIIYLDNNNNESR